MPLALRLSEGLGRNFALVKIENHLGIAQMAVQPSVAINFARFLEERWPVAEVAVRTILRL